jgi:hypothetical protein
LFADPDDGADVGARVECFALFAVSLFVDDRLHGAVSLVNETRPGIGIYADKPIKLHVLICYAN